MRRTRKRIVGLAISAKYDDLPPQNGQLFSSESSSKGIILLQFMRNDDICNSGSSRVKETTKKIIVSTNFCFLPDQRRILLAEKSLHMTDPSSYLPRGNSTLCEQNLGCNPGPVLYMMIVNMSASPLYSSTDKRAACRCLEPMRCYADRLTCCLINDGFKTRCDDG